MIKDRLNPGPSSSQTAENSLDLIKSIKSHHFQYGLRYPASNGRASVLNERGSEYVVIQPASLLDSVWYGDCVESALLSYSSLRDSLPKHLLPLIHTTNSSIGRTNVSTNHYRVIVEDLRTRSTVAIIDHSKFFERYFGKGKQIWNTAVVEHLLQFGRRPNMRYDTCSLVPYTEFMYRRQIGMCYFSFERAGSEFRIKLTLIFPEQTSERDQVVRTSIVLTSEQLRNYEKTIRDMDYWCFDKDALDTGVEINEIGKQIFTWLKELTEFWGKSSHKA